ncbi:MAG: iron-containing alcohol dehydrogenase [Deltaproteobacteria bacterium]|jgi:alcohol dehydrogenase class IV|nr:iron-containing alcohol dehydrogenase [Deltaproteobacteria bacterium]
MSSRFITPRDVYFGPGAIENLKNLKGKKAVVCIGGSSLKKSGALDRILGYLAEAKIETKIIDGIEADPSLETVYAGAKVMHDFGPDWIVAVGGGSAIDAAKCMWVFYENPDIKFEALLAPHGFPPLRKKARLAAVSTTSGTGTEVTAASVITDHKIKVKHPLIDYQLTPDVAIVDPELTYSLPPAVVASTGMDALTHAMEAYVAKAHNPFSDAPGLMAIELIFANLEKSYNGDLEGRKNIHYAQTLAGISFNSAFLGIVHSIAHTFGAYFKVPHGFGNALALANSIQYNARHAESLIRFADMARFLGLPGRDNNILVDNLVGAVRDLNRRVGIPPSYKAYGVPEAEFRQHVSTMAQKALGDICTAFNPREIDAVNMEKVYWCAYEGTNVIF